MAKLVIASNEKNLVAGLRSLMEGEGHHVVSACNDAESLVVVESSQPEIIILSPFSPAGLLVETIARLQGLGRKVVLLLERPTDACDIAKLNADGIVVTSPQVRQLLECIETVEAGRRWMDPDVVSLFPESQRTNQDSLTSRERQIVEGVVRGLRNKEIAREMNLHECTVKMHLHRIFDKLKLGSRTQLALAFSSTENTERTKFNRRANTYQALRAS